MPSVLHLFRAPRRGLPMAEVGEIQAIEDLGFEACAHARAGSARQVLLMDMETLDALLLTPGIVRESITTEGLNVHGLQAGQRLCIEQVILEVTVPCTPCSQMEKIRAGLRKEIRGRRGMLCRVLRGGLIRRGAPIEKLT